MFQYQNIQDDIEQGLNQLAPPMCSYFKEKLGLPEIPSIFFTGAQNGADPLGPTGQFDPKSMRITIFTANRHIKDILRSLAHELYHYFQQQNNPEAATAMTNISSEGSYAQSDDALRTIEKEAYEKGNMLFRDWEDGKKMYSDRIKEHRTQMLLEHMGYKI